MTILVLGGGGTVGQAFLAQAALFSEPLELASRRGPGSVDITDLDAVRRKISRGTYAAVVNLAAATDVDRCEREPSWAYAVNTAGAKNVAIAAREAGTDLVHVSTTSVFGGDGAKGPFSEMDTPCPANVYARSKLAGELEVRHQQPCSYVVRTAWVMGGGHEDKKFVGKVAARLLAGESVKAVNDEWGAPTWSHDLVAVIEALIKTRAYGLYHATGRGRATRFDMVQHMKQHLGSASSVDAVSASSFDLAAPRPQFDEPVSLALPALGLGELMPTWQDGLSAYLRTFTP